MKSVCIQRPNVLKHFQQLMLKRDGEGIKVLMDAPEFFDEDMMESHGHNTNTDSNDTADNNNEDDQHIKSITFMGDTTDSGAFLEDDEPEPFCILAVHDEEDCAANNEFSVVDTTDYLHSTQEIDKITLYNDDGVEQIRSLTFDDALPSVKLLESPHMVQVDGGADRSTTPHRELVHGFRPPDESQGEKTTINDAGVHSHKIVGYGYFKVRCFDKHSTPIIIHVPCACIPSIPSTLLSFRNMPNLLHLEETSSVLLGVAQAIIVITNRNDNPNVLRASQSTTTICYSASSRIGTISTFSRNPS
jgi:hypothetical protein